MKWKAVTRRTRFLGFMAIVSAALALWAWFAERRNPCTYVAQLATPRRLDSRGPLREPRAAHLVRVQDSDSSDGDEDLQGTPMERPDLVNPGRLAPCGSKQNIRRRVRGAASAGFIVFGLTAFFSFHRDRRRYGKRLRGRARRDEYRRRRDAGFAQSTQAPSKVREGFADVCACGCGEGVAAGEQFVPGHAQMLRLELEQKAGGLLALRDLVEHQFPDDTPKS